MMMNLKKSYKVGDYKSAEIVFWHDRRGYISVVVRSGRRTRLFAVNNDSVSPRGHLTLYRELNKRLVPRKSSNRRRKSIRR